MSPRRHSKLRPQNDPILTAEYDPAVLAQFPGSDDCPSFFGSCSLLLCVMALGAGALGYGAFGYLEDCKWNDVVEGKRAFPSVENCKYFEGKTFRLPGKDFEPLRVDLRRNGLVDLVFLGSISAFLVVTLFLCCVFVLPTKIKPWLFFGGFLNAVVGVLLWLLVLNGYSDHAQKAYGHLNRYRYYNTTYGSTAPRNIEEITILQAVVQLCHRPLTNTIASVEIRGKHCQKLDLVDVGFCQDYPSKLGAVAFAFLLALLCWIVSLCTCCCDCDARCLKRKRHHRKPVILNNSLEVPCHCPSGPELEKTKGAVYCPAYPPFNAADYDNENYLPVSKSPCVDNYTN